jgi:DNA-binding MarR family transcriptional regulator
MDAVDRIVEAWARRDPDVDATPLEVVGRILLCAGRLERMILAALEPFELSFGDFDVLNTLRRIGSPEGTNPKVLARSALITSGAVTSRLNRLERRKLIERTPDPEDGRGVLVALTPDGERIAREALHAVVAADREFLEPLDERQRSALASALKPLVLSAEG